MKKKIRIKVKFRMLLLLYLVGIGDIRADVIHSDTKKLRAELVIGFPPLVGEEMSFSH